jgi:DNA-binding beta-propeller fold protein YncE
VLFIDAGTYKVTGTVDVGGKPNGLAWDSRRRRVLVADVAGNSVAIVDPGACRIIASGSLPGRPRWTVYDAAHDHFLVNVREPSIVAVVDSETAHVVGSWTVSAAGPHGLDLDPVHARAFVACDEGRLVCLDLNDGSEVAEVGIAGEPDAIWFDSGATSVYVAVSRPGLIQVVDADRMVIRETIEIEEGAKTTALDAPRRSLYVFKPRSCSVAAYQVT